MMPFKSSKRLALPSTLSMYAAPCLESSVNWSIRCVKSLLTTFYEVE